jgi:hypothetical protein
MIRFWFNLFLFVICFSFQAYAARIDTLIAATQESLVRQKNVKSLLEQYQKAEKASIAKPNNVSLLYDMAAKGAKLYDAICDSGLIEYFPEQFVQELQKLKTITDNKNIPPAR